MSQNYFLVSGVQCSVEDEDGELMIDLRPAGFLERSIPHELLDHPKIKKILLFHKNVPTILESTVDKLGRSLSIEVFDECSDNNPFKKFQFSKYLWKTCQIDSNQYGIIRLDIRCDALTRELVFSPRKKKLRQLKLRGYRRGVLARCNRAITEDLEELVIASGEPGPKITVNVGWDRLGEKNVERFAEITFQDVTVETSLTKITRLEDSSESKSISLEGMTNLKRFLLSANGKQILPTGMVQLHNLQELCIFDNPIGDHFKLSCFPRNLRKLILFNCGLKVFPFAITQLKDLEVLELYFNDFHNQVLILSGLAKLKRLVIICCKLNTYPEGLENCINLEYLDLSSNESLGRNAFTITQFKNLKKLVMYGCGLKHVPEGLENCTNLEYLKLSDNKSLGQNPFTITQFKNLKKLVMYGCGLKHVPEGLENCINLEYLDLSDNKSLGEENVSIPMLEKLTSLTLWNCGFRFVPNDVVELPSLQYLNMGSNRLKELPERFTNLIEKKVRFQLIRNVLCKPPQVICGDGNAIVDYFKSIAKFGEAHSKRLRVLVFGNSGAGKTSLVNGLLMGRSRLTKKEERTEGIEIRKWYPDPANQDLEFEIWDFGGHMEYQSVSHYFLEEHSLFLLVVDLFKYKKTDESYHENAGKWIDEVKSIVLRPIVMVAATKSDLIDDSSVREDRCRHMLEKIDEQERQDMKSIKSDLQKLLENDYSNAGRRKKLDVLISKRPVLPKGISVALVPKKEGSSNEDTYVVTVSAGPPDRFAIGIVNSMNTFSLSQKLVRTGSNTNHFPHLKTTLPSLWVEIEESLPTLIEEMENNVGPKYLSFDELKNWLCQQHQKFKEDINKKDTLNAVLAYLVKLGKVLRFERVEQLSNFIFPDPQWLIKLVKEVVHHDLQTHLEFKKDFKACDMDIKRFENEKQELIGKGLLSESLLRCIWFDAVPKKADFKKLVALLYHFDVGYRMTRKEAEFKGKEISKNYILIPALMSETKPVGIEDLWPSTASENEFETKSIYSFLSTLPVGLFERQMVRCHHGSDFMRHWKKGFFGVTNYEEPDEAKFYVTKQKDTIEFTVRIKNNGPTNTLWKVVLHLHQIFANMVEELWPELRYVIYNKCPECNDCHHEMDFERLLEAPHSYSRNVLCRTSGGCRPVKVNKELVFPPQDVVEEFKRNKDSSEGESIQIMVRDIPYLVRVEICRLLNIRTDRCDFRRLAGILQMKTSDIQFLCETNDPPDEVLKWWEIKNSATLQRFREILREMQREDIVQILDDEYQSGSRNPRKTSRDDDIGPPSKHQKR